MDASSVYKICPQCGQSVSVAAKYCPTCGTPFAAEEADFVAYERYPLEPDVPMPEVQVPPAPAAEEPLPYPGFRGPDSAGGGQEHTVRTLSGADPISFTPVAPQAETYDPEPDYDEEDEEEPQGNRKAVIIVAIAAIVLLAIIIGGIFMAFRLGFLGGGTPEEDSMTVAQEAYNGADYAAAIAELEKLVESGEATVAAYELLAECYDATGDLEKVADTYLRGYQTLSESSLKNSAKDAYLKLGDQARDAGNIEAARSYYNSVLTNLDPSNSTAIARLAALSEEPEPSAEPTLPGSALEDSALPEDSVVEDSVIDEDPENIAPPENPEDGEDPQQPGGSDIVLPGQTQPEADVPTTSAPAVSYAPIPVTPPEYNPTPTPAPTPKPTPTPAPTPTPTPPPAYQFELDGHKYELVIGKFTWEQAKADAESRGGHMATINSEEELEKCAEIARNYDVIFLWLDASVAQKSDWEDPVWNTGEPMDYTKWYKGEPNFGNENEYYLAMFSVNLEWYFNDAPADVISTYGGRMGYVLEVE